MDGAMASGLISGGIVLGVNAIGWAITLVRGSNQESRLAGAFKQKLDDVCTDVDKVDAKVDKVDAKVEKVNDKIVSHITNHPGRSRK
jgi:outer membrane murein-binding lipoprotein Lpp